jgi:hypothetical protein
VHAHWGTATPIAISIAALVVSIGGSIAPYYRRPKLTLREDESREHSRVEGNGIPHVRAVVENAMGKRSAKHVRVVLDGARKKGDDQWTRFGSPFLAWPSVFGQESDAYVDVIFAGTSRPVGIGQMMRVRRTDAGKIERGYHPAGGTWIVMHDPADADGQWHLHLELAGNFQLTDERDWLTPGEWVLRLVAGADDGDAHTCEVHLAWRGDEPNAEMALANLLDHLAVRSGWWLTAGR